MAEDLRDVPPPPGAEDEEDVLGKLDQLLHKHRPGTSEPGASPPELTDSLRSTDSPVPGNIPTLVDRVSDPVREPSHPQRPNPIPSINADAVLEAGINLRLAVKLESERARLLERIGNDPERAQALDQLITELKRSLPGIVRSVLSDEPPRN